MGNQLAEKGTLLRPHEDTETDLEATVTRFYQNPGSIDLVGSYAPLQAKDRPHWCSLGFWVVSKYDEATHLLKEGKAVRAPPAASSEGSPMGRLFEHFLTMVDRDDHRRMRGLVQKAFTPNSVGQLTETIDSRARECIRAAKRAGGMDVITDFAQVLPSSVFSSLLGVPYTDRAKFIQWINGVIDGYHPGTSPDVVQKANESAQSLMDYMDSMIADRRVNPGDDLLTSLVEVEEAGQSLSMDELRGVSCHILLAGVETTVGMLGNTFLAMAEHPEELERLRNNPTFIDGALEECLRFDPPINSAPMRVMIEDVRAGDGAVMAKGDLVTVLLGATNRDPSVFSRPTEFDISRDPNPHLSFSTGMNFCLGAHLARLEGRIALRAMIEELDGFALATDTLEYRSTAVVHSLESLPIDCW